MSSGGVIYEGGKFKLEAQDGGEGPLLLSPIGVLNEDVNFGAVLEAITQLGIESDTYRFDLGRVVTINSCGIREWLLLLQRIQRNKTVEFQNVSEVVIDQANIVPSVLGKAGSRVISFFLPFFNSETQDRKMVLVETAAFLRARKSIEALKMLLPGKPEDWEFDAIEAEYLNFLKHVKE